MINRHDVGSAFLIAMMALMPLAALAQQQLKKPVKNWYNLDLRNDGVFGISMDKAYNEVLKGKTATKVIVAVIDGGVDTEHEDLKEAIWTNAREKPTNKKDDDKNGYIDDVHGWNFMGNSEGSFIVDNTDQVRELREIIKKDPNSPKISSLSWEINKRRDELLNYTKTIEPQLKALDAIIKAIGKANPTESDFRSYRYRNVEEAKALVDIVKAYKDGEDFRAHRQYVEGNYKNAVEQANFWLNIAYNPRTGKEFEKPFYGNGDVKGEDALHGTHAAGIIAAIRNNQKGTNGVASEVLIMPLRAIPRGQGLDSEIASAIRYAVDNGAKVINMSYGKEGSPDRKLVDDAVKYAMAKDVLIVHAAGNEGQERQTEYGFPSRKYLDGGSAEAWIEVGASGPQDDETLLAWFSNYGKETVDVFAPGVEIYSTIPDHQYAYESGTSMAAPVVSGLAAMLRSYYPKLTAVQVKDIILKSVIKSERLRDKCSSGGIVSAYAAFILANK